MTIQYKHSKIIDSGSLFTLYENVGWSAYTKDLPLLQLALQNSLYVRSAWKDDQLVGLVRVVGDGLTIIYIQDILVLGAFQNQGIASRLMEQVLDDFQQVRQKVLLTEEAPDVRHFYEKHGFKSCDKGSAVAFGRFE